MADGSALELHKVSSLSVFLACVNDVVRLEEVYKESSAREESI